MATIGQPLDRARLGTAAVKPRPALDKLALDKPALDKQALVVTALVGATLALVDLSGFAFIAERLDMFLITGAAALLLATYTITRFLVPAFIDVRGVTGRRRDALSPPTVVALFLTLITFGRGLYVSHHHMFGLDDSQPLTLAAHRHAFVAAIAAGYLSVALLLIGDVAVRFWVAHRQRQAVARDAATAEAVEKEREEPLKARKGRRRPSEAVLLVVLFLSLLVGALSFLLAVHYAQGFGNYLTVLGSRELFFAGRGWLFLALTAATGPVLAWFALQAPDLRRGRWGEWAFAALLLLAAIGGGWATGTRTEIVFSLLLPLLVIFHFRVRPLPLRFLVIAALCVFVGLSLYRVTLRGSSDGTQTSLWQAPVETFASLDSRLPDATASLFVLQPPRENGRTLAAAFVAPVPRRLWPGKPLSGNADFTKVVSPSHYSQSRSEYGLTFTGELIWNFGWLGLAGFALLGMALAGLHSRVRRLPGPVGVLLYAGALDLTLNLVRTDLFTSMIELVRVFAPALIVLGLALACGRREPLPAAEPGRASPQSAQSPQALPGTP